MWRWRPGTGWIVFAGAGGAGAVVVVAVAAVVSVIVAVVVVVVVVQSILGLALSCVSVMCGRR